MSSCRECVKQQNLELAEALWVEKKLRPLKPFSGSILRSWKSGCLICGHETSLSPANLMRGQGVPYVAQDCMVDDIGVKPGLGDAKTPSGRAENPRPRCC